MKVIIHNHRGRTLKRLLDERLDFDPDFIDALAENEPEVQEAAYKRIEPHTRRRVRKLVERKMAGG